MILAGHGQAALAFGPGAHRVAGEIAERRLCPAARAYVAPLLDGSTLASAGTWADAIRDDPQWLHTRPWHYINVGDRQHFAEVMRDEAGNVLGAIERSERDLADARLPLKERAEALRFFVHFVADLHQPLHVGRAEDRGGNDVEVRWGKERMSLHEFWDGSALLRSTGLDQAGLARSIGALAIGQERRWQGGTAQEWAGESRAYRPLVYDLPPARDGAARLDRAYVATARNIVSLRLAQAGVRLAGRLNALAGCRDAAAPAPGGHPSH
jgi:hypothetical protein